MIKRIKFFMSTNRYGGRYGGLVLVHRTQDQEVWVRALSGLLCHVYGQDTYLLSQCLSPPRSLNRYMYQQTVRET